MNSTRFGCRPTRNLHSRSTIGSYRKEFCLHTGTVPHRLLKEMLDHLPVGLKGEFLQAMINTEPNPRTGRGCAAAGRVVEGARLERGSHLRIERAMVHPELSRTLLNLQRVRTPPARFSLSTTHSKFCPHRALFASQEITQITIPKEPLMRNAGRLKLDTTLCPSRRREPSATSWSRDNHFSPSILVPVTVRLS